jgi:predicted ATPase/DNA-binding SARP family transcriptional activator
MEFRILGSFEIVGATGPIDVRGAKRRGLMACLLVHAGQPMSTDRLVEELWGNAASAAAARTVQTYVSQLRKILRGESAGLETRPDGYVLEIASGDVDAHCFEQAVDAVAAEVDPARRLVAVNGALELWRGPPLREFAGAGWADREATRLEARHLHALWQRHDALMALDRAPEAASELELLASVHPLDERVWGQLMLALYRSGRQSDALGAYQRARRHLINELGIEPGPELADLEHRILDHDPTLAGPADRRATTDEHGTPTDTTTDRWYPRTFLLTDIVGSVSLWERDPAAMSRTVARHDAIIQEAVGISGGELVRTKGEGDSTFSVFVHPSDALAAAATIHEAVASEPWPPMVPLQVRAAVHTGDAEARDGDWYGPAVNRAARLRGLAKGGQTLASGVTAGLVADQTPKGVKLLYWGRRGLRGIERPEEVWELVPVDEATTSPGREWPGAAGLPVALTRFVGRTEEVQRLAELVAEARLVTLTGAGGSGKTRLAVEVARDAERRGEVVWMAELAPLREGELVAQATAAAVGVEAGPDPLDALLAEPEALAGLLVLDNCEHLLDACAALTARLLSGAPGLRVLATSREPLDIAGEREWPVTPLDIPAGSLRNREQATRVESVQLLLDRARAVRSDLEVRDDDVAAVVHICRALDGMPLAIELAAGRLRSLTFADLAARLDDQLAVLARRRASGPNEARHRSLRLTLDWSYELLTDDQRALAARLSVFAGGFRLDAVQAVCGGDLDVLDGIDELVAKSLVTFDGVTTRYRLLEPIRQYLAERMEETGATESTQRAHAEWVVGLCKRLGSHLLTGQKAGAVRLGEETANVDTALDWALTNDEHEMALRIVGSLSHYWFFNDQATGRRWCNAVTNAATETDAVISPRTRARAMLSMGLIAQNDGLWDRSVACLRKAMAIYRAEDQTAGHAEALYWLGRGLASSWNPTQIEDDTTQARQCFEDCARLFIQINDTLGEAWCRVWLSLIAFWEGDLDRATCLANEVVDECDETGVRHPVGQALCNLAYVAHGRGQDQQALELLQDAVALYRDLDDEWQQAEILVDLAAQEATAGRGREALRALAESSQLDQKLGRRTRRSFTLAAAAVVHLARGEAQLSVAALGAYDAHPIPFYGRPRGTAGGYIGWLAEAVATTRSQLDPNAVAAAAAAARRVSLDRLIDELIIRQADSA